MPSFSRIISIHRYLVAVLVVAVVVEDFLGESHICLLWGYMLGFSIFRCAVQPGIVKPKFESHSSVKLNKIFTEMTVRLLLPQRSCIRVMGESQATGVQN